MRKGGATLRATGSTGGARVELVDLAIDGGRSLLCHVPGTERHRVHRVVDDVVLGARTLRPTVDANVRVAAGASRFLDSKISGDGAQGGDGLATP